MLALSDCSLLHSHRDGREEAAECHASELSAGVPFREHGIRSMEISAMKIPNSTTRLVVDSCLPDSRSERRAAVQTMTISARFVPCATESVATRSAVYMLVCR